MYKILLVDDDDFVMEYLTNTLQQYFVLETANDGQQALEKFSTSQPDLVLMDIQMPKLNGYEAAKCIRKTNKHTPILFLSSLHSLDERLSAYDAGGDDFISKPANPNELIKKINILLETSLMNLEQKHASDVATKALSDLSYLGQVISFFRNSYQCNTFEQLAQVVFDVTETFGLSCSLVFRESDDNQYFFDDGLEKNIDAALLESLNGARRILEFGNYRAALNWGNCSLLVKNMPTNEVEFGAMKDYLSYLMDGIDQCAAKLVIEIQLRQAVIQFKEKSQQIKQGVVGLIDDLENDLESLFSSLNVNDELSQTTEEQLLSLLDTARSKADQKLLSGRDTEDKLGNVLVMFQAQVKQSKQEIELF